MQFPGNNNDTLLKYLLKKETGEVTLKGLKEVDSRDYSQEQCAYTLNKLS